MTNASFYDHFLSWYPHRHREDVLFLFFEDMKEDLPGTVRKVADFMQIEADEAKIDRAIDMSSFDFMREHSNQFDEKLSKLARNGAMGLPTNAGLKGHPGKIRAGESGGGRAHLGEELVAELDARWAVQMEPATGFASYQALRVGCQ